MSADGELYNERVVKVSSWSLNVLTYPVGRSYVCIVSNLDPQATICRTKADSEEKAFEEAIALATIRLQNEPSRKPDIVLDSGAHLNEIHYQTDDGVMTFSSEEFRTIGSSRRTDMFMSGLLTFYDSRGLPVSSGEAVRLLLSLA
jgi:hypothetical protein